VFCVLALLAAPAAGMIQAVRVENLAGGVSVTPTPAEQPAYRVVPAEGKGACREQTEADTGTLQIRCPAGSAKVDVEVELPVGMPFAGVTSAGAISFSGVSQEVFLSTDRGDLRIAVPWSLMRLSGFALSRPKRVSAARGIAVRSFEQPGQWVVVAGRSSTPELPLEGAFFGEIRIRGGSPGRLELEELPVPAYSWVKPPSAAATMLSEWLKRAGGGARRNAAPPARPAQAAPAEAGMPVFSTEVRMVNLSVSVTDAAGRPVVGLKPEDFEVREGGVVQTLARAESEEAAFNLALLLDLSGSTKGYREAMKEVARGFAGIARRQDKVAVYALGNSLFYVISRLTHDREALLDKIDSIPPVEGQTPLYDTIFLSCAEELLELGEARNALIVITDGVDSSLSTIPTPGRSLITPGALRDAASRMNVLIYPVLTGTDDWPLFAAAARRNLEQVARASGGRTFEAKSIEAMAPVYGQFAEELRSVYTLAYYPRDQNFDGRWRRLEVRVKSPGLKVRAREGYYAR
jgi:Ca-activated chloride channel family protein